MTIGLCSQCDELPEECTCCPNCKSPNFDNSKREGYCIICSGVGEARAAEQRLDRQEDA